MAGHFLGPARINFDTGQLQSVNHVAQEVGLFAGGLYQGKANAGATELQRQAGETGAGAHVHNLGVGRKGCSQSRQHSQGVQEVLNLHLVIFNNTGEVHAAVPVGQFAVVSLELRQLGIVQGQPQFRGSLGQ